MITICILMLITTCKEGGGEREREREREKEKREIYYSFTN